METLIGLFVIVCWFIGASGPQMANVVQNAGHGRAAMPREPGLIRVGIGGGWLAVSAYLFFTPMPGGLFSRNQILLGGAALALWGAASLFLGLSISRGQRDFHSAARALCLEALPGAAGLWLPLYISRDWGGELTPLINYALRGCWIYLLAYGLSIIALSMRGVGGNALRAIKRELARRNAPLRPPRKPSRFRFRQW